MIVFHISRFMINRESGKELTVLFQLEGLYKRHLPSTMQAMMTGRSLTTGITGTRILQVKQVLTTLLQ